MSQALETDDRETYITNAIIDAGRFLGTGFGLAEGFGEKSQEVADLLERRLSRLDQALGFDPICAR